MGGWFRRGGRVRALASVVGAAAGALMMTACASGSYQEAAMAASDAGDQKTATSLARKEVARFDRPDQCSPATTLNCGTLALAYSTLASYQILDGDPAGGEDSFRRAQAALALTEPANRASATAIVYRDVSEAFWTMGDRARAIDIFREGRVAGADEYLYMSSAARAVEPRPATDRPPTAPPPADRKPADRKPTDDRPTD